MWLDFALSVRFFVATASLLRPQQTESYRCRSSALANVVAAAVEDYRNEMMFFLGTPLPQPEIDVKFYITNDSDVGFKQIVAIILSVIGALLTGFACSCAYKRRCGDIESGTQCKMGKL
ncbi:hypothetical protein Tco_0036267 [Tanacetum coccineum]